MMTTSSTRLLAFHSTYAGVVLFTNEDKDTPSEEATHFRMTEKDWTDMGMPKEVTITIKPGDLLNPPAPDVPHSRACGVRKHLHGTECSTNCPTCHGRPMPGAASPAGERLAR